MIQGMFLCMAVAQFASAYGFKVTYIWAVCEVVHHLLAAPFC